MNNDIPKQITQTLYIEYAESYEKPYRINAIDMSQYWPVLGTVDVTVDVPDNLRDPIESQIDVLTQKRERIQTETAAELNNIDERIKRLGGLVTKENAS